MKTLGQFIHAKNFPVEICDSNGNRIYYETSIEYWSIREYDTNGNETYYEDSDGFWSKSEYDSNGRVIYYENSYGYIRDDR